MDMKDVLISIKGLQSLDDGGDEAVEFVTDGKYGYSESGSELSYMESELTGLDGTRTSFVIGPEGVVLQREGTVNTRMVFEQGKKHLFLYETPYGTATLNVDTKRVVTKLDAHGGDMEILYAVGVENETIGQNRFRIHVREIGS